MVARKPIKPNERFGRLTVIGRASDKIMPCGTRIFRVHAKCDCGNKITVYESKLRFGHTQSCGCITKERMKKAKYGLTHGMTGTPEYRAWRTMHQRCTDRKHQSWPHYGGKGIKVSNRWKTFEAFFNDMGFRPNKGYSLDRIDGNKNYEPSNCRWATDLVQQRNRSNNSFVIVDDVRMCLSEAAQALNVSYKWLYMTPKNYRQTIINLILKDTSQ